MIIIRRNLHLSLGPSERLCDVPHRLERRIKHPLEGCGNLPIADTF